MLIYTNLGEYKVNASQINGKVMKAQNKYFNSLLLCSNYQRMSAQKQVMYAIYVANVPPKVTGCLYTAYGQYCKHVQLLVTFTV